MLSFFASANVPGYYKGFGNVIELLLLVRCKIHTNLGTMHLPGFQNVPMGDTAGVTHGLLTFQVLLRSKLIIIQLKILSKFLSCKATGDNQSKSEPFCLIL